VTGRICTTKRFNTCCPSNRSRHISPRPFAVIYTTPRRRVQETAQIITQTLDLPAVTETNLRGPDRGQADARSWQEIKTAFGGPPQHDPTSPTHPARNPGTPTLIATPTP
jgi:broad specificity phosphatase PhoE